MEKSEKRVGPDKPPTEERQRLPPALADRLAAFNERVRAAREVQCPAPTLRQARNFVASARILLSGEQRFEYLGGVLLREPDAIAEECGNDLQDMKSVFGGLHSVGDDELRRQIGSAFSSPHRARLLADPLRWIWLLREVPWVASRIPSRDRDQGYRIASFIKGILTEYSDQAYKDLLDELDKTDSIAWHCLSLLLHDTRGACSFSRSPEQTLDRLEMGKEDILAMAGKRVVDLGSGLSWLALGLREHGVDAYGVDRLSVDELLALAMPAASRKHTRQELAKMVSEYLSPRCTALFRQCDAANLHMMFGEGSLDHVLACCSILHEQVMDTEYARDPKKFAAIFEGVLRSLSSAGGEFRAASHPLLFSPGRTDKFFVPLLLALYAGRFEVPGLLNEDGKARFEAFMLDRIRLQPDSGRCNPFICKRQPFSDPDKACAALRILMSDGEGDDTLQKIF